MTYRRILYLALIVLISGGLMGGVRLSYMNFSGASRCPYIGFVALCYLVATGYLAMLLGVFFTTQAFGRVMFRIGWSVALLLASIGTGLEFTLGGVCPQSGSGIPLCYVSLLFSTIIGIMYVCIHRNKLPNGAVE